MTHVNWMIKLYFELSHQVEVSCVTTPARNSLINNDDVSIGDPYLIPSVTAPAHSSLADNDDNSIGDPLLL